MPAHSPPRSSVILAILILFERCASIGACSELVLPDLVFLRIARPDISQPELANPVGRFGSPALPSYRRRYPLAIRLQDSLTAYSPSFIDGIVHPRAVEPVPGVQRNILETTANARSGLIRVSDHPSGHPGVRIITDLRDGVDIEGIVGVSDRDAITIRGGIPFTDSSPVSLAAGVRWNHVDRLLSDIRIGIKQDTKTALYEVLRLGWNGGVRRPDSYRLDVHGYGIEGFGAAALAGTRIIADFSNSGWILHSGIDAGVSNSLVADDPVWEGTARADIGLGYLFQDRPLEIRAGADLALTPELSVIGAPRLGLFWSPVESLRLYVDSGLIAGYPPEVDVLLETEKIDGFLPGIPVRSRYRFGLDGHFDTGWNYSGDLFFGHGTFVSGNENRIITREDARLGGSLQIGFDTGMLRIDVDGRWDHSLRDGFDIWETGAAVYFGPVLMSVDFGTEDALLGRGLPGIRGENPILGIGVGWSIDENWGIEALGYAGLPWEDPSLKLALNWSD